MKGSMLAEQIDREYRMRQMYEKKPNKDRKEEQAKKKTNKSQSKISS